MLRSEKGDSTLSNAVFFGAVIAMLLLFVLIIALAASQKRISPEQQAQLTNGRISPQVICPHCQTRGTVRTKAIKKKVGISGGKATAALLTGGVSLLATGLARKEALTQAHCENCNSTWSF